MNSLPEALPDVDSLLSLQAEELAAILLPFLRRHMQNGRIRGRSSAPLSQCGRGTYSRACNAGFGGAFDATEACLTAH